MAIFSTLRTVLRNSLKRTTNNVVSRPMSDHRTFDLQSSRLLYQKFKDLVHFYTMLGVIPLTLTVVFCNTFIGPATLSEIPEGYVPKYWEYHRSPISRFLARYVFTDPQQEYEKYLAYIFIEHEKIRLREIEQQVKEKIRQRRDYQAYYYKPAFAKYHRAAKEAYDTIQKNKGDF